MKIWQPLSDYELLSMGAKMHDHMIEATKASIKWNVRNEWLTEYCRLNRIIGKAKDDKFAKDVELAGHLGSWSFHERESKRFAQAIQAEHAMRQMMGVSR